MRNEHWFIEELAEIAREIRRLHPRMKGDKLGNIIEAFAQEANLTTEQVEHLCQRAKISEQGLRPRVS